MATACLLRTRLAFVGEVQNYYQAAKTAIADVQLVPNNDPYYPSNADENPYEMLDVAGQTKYGQSMQLQDEQPENDDEALQQTE